MMRDKELDVIRWVGKGRVCQLGGCEAPEDEQ